MFDFNLGRRVRVSGVSKVADGAEGRIVRGLDPSTSCYHVELYSPSPVLARHLRGVSAKQINLQVLPPQMGVCITGMSVVARELTDAESACVILPAANWSPASAAFSAPSPAWRTCRVPTALGLPLMLQQLAPRAIRVPGIQEAATFLRVDPACGKYVAHSPESISGLGPVLVARSDGVAFTVGEMVSSPGL